MSSPGDDDSAYEEVSENIFKMKENVCYQNLKKVSEGQSSPTARIYSSRKKVYDIALLVIVVVLVLSLVAACIGFAVEIAKIKSQDINGTLQANLFLLQSIDMKLQELGNSTEERFENIVQQTIDLLYNTLIGNISSLASKLSFSRAASSCAALPPSSPSGYYWVRASNGSAVRVYCDMTRSCGGVTGGWMRVAELDMTNSSHQCPSGLGQQNDLNIHTCVRDSDSRGCSSVMFSTSSVSYTTVCGRIIAYQYGTPDAFNLGHSNSTYFDGVSLTHGSPREHIWSFVAAHDELASITGWSCPCVRNNLNIPIPPSVGDDYFCDTGSRNDSRHNIFYSDDPLWDGAGCGPLSTCCSFNSPPWFYKQLPQPTTDDIEMRVCRNKVRDNEDIAIEIIDIFVR